MNNQYDDEDESSTDEDFNPEAVDPEAKSGGDEEYDSDAADRSTDSEDRGSVSLSKNSQIYKNFRTIVARPRTHQSKRKKRRKRKKIENDLAMVEQTNPLKRRKKPRLKECQNDQ